MLLVRRNSKIAFHGGSWVFPGGKVDSADRTAESRGDQLEVARRAAAREAHEETGLKVEGSSLLPFSHWTTPEQMPKRFATWFFVAQAGADETVQIDRSEIVDYRWVAFDDALGQRERGEIELPAPTFVSLSKLRAFRDTAAIMHHLTGRGVETFVPRIVELDDGRCAVYKEDAAYSSLDLGVPGARHRLMMLKSGWRYITET